MKNKLYYLFIILVTVFFVSSVSKTLANKSISVSNIQSHNSYYQDVTKMLLNLDTYALSGKVTYISNNDKHTYEMLQYAKKDGTYRIELLQEDGSKLTTIYDNETIFQFTDDLSDVVNISTTENSERSEIFITKFMENYENSKNVSVVVSNINDSLCTVLEASIPGGHHYFSSEKLFIDNESLTPIKLIIYDSDGLERILVEFDQFIANPTLDEKIFSIN